MRPRQTSGPSGPIRGFLHALGGISALALVSCSAGTPPPPSPPPDAPAARYVGSRPCATCHAAVAKSFARTGMGRSFYSVDRILLPPGAGSPVRPRVPDAIEIPDQDLRYDVFQREGRLYQKQYRLDARGLETRVDAREAIYVLGSGNHSQSFVTAHDGRLYQMPLCWYPEADRWDLCPGYELRNPYFSREVDDTCLFCHNGRVVRTGGFDNRFVEPIPEGIDCERCHGPGSAHVERWSSPSPGDSAARPGGEEEADPTIVNPKRLPPDLRLQVCMQCHLGDSARTERVMLKPDHLDGVRPGQPLREHLAVHRFREPLPGRFGLGAQADRLVLSRCFTSRPGEMQCTLCHDPHVEVYDGRAEGSSRFDRACATCHAAGDCAMPAARRAAEGCVDCHMRRAEPHDQRYTTFTDHWIRRRPSEGIDRVGTDYRMEPLEIVLGEIGSPSDRLLSLGRAQLYKKLGSPDGAAMPWDLAVEPLTRAGSIDPADARPSFYLGKIEMSRGRPAAAVPHFQRAARLDPGYVEAAQELGSALLAAGSPEEAARELERALALGPPAGDRGAVLNELARIQMQRGRYREARARLDEAFGWEPLGVEVNANFGVLAELEKDTPAAIDWYVKALALAPNHPALHVYLAGALARAGPAQDIDSALQAARRAVKLDPSSGAARAKLTEICRAAGRARCDPGRPDTAE